MDKTYREPFNRAWSDAFYADFVTRLTSQVGPIPFRLAETPLFVDAPLRTELAGSAAQIARELAEPKLLAELKKAIPREYDVPGMDPLPNCVQVDFALCPGPDGRLTGKVIELQAFPSLYALMDFKARAWSDTMQSVPELRREWTCYVDTAREDAVAHVRRALLDKEDPEHVVLVDIEPEHQKTLPDFVATQKLYGVDYVCVTKLIKEGRNLFRMKDGKRVPVKRIFNRMVFDELEKRKVVTPFHWNDDLDLTWCSHPNWYWTWSKFVLPHLKHASVPRSRYLSQVDKIPDDLSGYVLKPLFSFAGTGVVIDVTRADIEKVPVEQRTQWVLQDKVTYAHALHMPDGTGVKAEVRVMLIRAPGETVLKPLQLLVRMSRGKMIGVDHNKDLTWVGGTVAIW